MAAALTITKASEQTSLIDVFADWSQFASKVRRLIKGAGQG